MNGSLSIGSERIGETPLRNKPSEPAVPGLRVGRGKPPGDRCRGLPHMRETRLFTTAIAAALASLLGLGPEAAADLESRPQAYQAQSQGSTALPIWLVRFK